MPMPVKGRPGVFLPETYDQRGYAVPFTTSVLAHARLRPSVQDGQEYLVPGLAGGRETYVIPKAKIADVVSMTVFDRALIEELAEEQVLSVETIRRAATSTYLTGLDGPGSKRNAEDWAKRNIDNRTLILALLISAAVDQLGTGKAHPTISELATLEGRNKAKEALQSFAEGAGVTPNRVFGMLEEWSRIITPLGSPGGEAVGPLLTVLIDMERFSSELSHWMLFEIETPALMAQRVNTAVVEVVKHARTLLNKIDLYAQKMDGSLRAWEQTTVYLAEHVTRFANVVDGWGRLIRKWDRAMALDRIDQREVVENFAYYHPMLPAEQYGGSEDIWADLRESQLQFAENREASQDHHKTENIDGASNNALRPSDLSTLGVER